MSSQLQNTEITGAANALAICQQKLNNSAVSGTFLEMTSTTENQGASALSSIIPG